MEQLERSKISSVLSYAQRIGFCAPKISKARATPHETMNYARRKRATLLGKARIFLDGSRGAMGRTATLPFVCVVRWRLSQVASPQISQSSLMSYFLAKQRKFCPRCGAPASHFAVGSERQPPRRGNLLLGYSKCEAGESIRRPIACQEVFSCETYCILLVDGDAPTGGRPFRFLVKIVSVMTPPRRCGKSRPVTRQVGALKGRGRQGGFRASLTPGRTPSRSLIS
jgi:hypothetical protein